MLKSGAIFADIVALLGLAGCTAVPVELYDADFKNREIKYDLIRSDLPLFTSGEDELWPRGFVRGNSIGCDSIVSFGDWRFDFVNSDEPEWIRFENYGVMHCWLNSWLADEREHLGVTDPRPAFFIHAEDVEIDGVPVELWAIQIGARPGSEYVLLSRSPADDDNSFTVLQTACPRSAVRQGGELSILRTDYCAINSKQKLIELMRNMVELPSAGRLTFAGVHED